MHPGYQCLSEDPRAFGCTIAHWKAEFNHQIGWQFGIQQLRDTINDNTKMLILNIPHNPTGWYPSSEEWDDIIALCRQHELFLFCDEVYGTIRRHDGMDYNTEACDLYERSLCLGSFSKTLCCPGIRLGWIATHDQVGGGLGTLMFIIISLVSFIDLHLVYNSVFTYSCIR